MGTNRIHRDAEQVCDVSACPIHSVDQEDSDTLPLGEVRQRIRQARLELGDSRRPGICHIMHRGRVEFDAMPSRPHAAPTHPIQVSDRVRHRAQIAPMLPAVRQCFCRRIPTSLTSHGGNEGMAQ